MSGKQQASAQRKAGRGGGVNDTLWSDDHKNRCPYFSTTSDARTFGACSFTVHDACRRPAASTVATQLARQCVPTAGAGRLNGRARGAALTSATCNVRRTRDREEPTDDSKQAPPLFPVDDFFSLGHCSLSAVTSLSASLQPLCVCPGAWARRGGARPGGVRAPISIGPCVGAVAAFLIILGLVPASRPHRRQSPQTRCLMDRPGACARQRAPPRACHGLTSDASCGTRGS